MSSSPIDIVKVFYGTLSLIGAAKAGQYLADDFTLDGFTAAPLDKPGWLAFLSALKQALPDLKIRLTDVKESGDQVKFTQTGLGTHRFPLVLSDLQLPDVAATGSSVEFPATEWLLTVSGGRINRAELITPLSPGTGLPGMLAALGVQPALTD